MQLARFRNLFTQCGNDGTRKNRDTILRAFAIANQYLVPPEVGVLDAQSHAFHHAHARAVEQATDQSVYTMQLFENARDLITREHDRQMERRFRLLDA